MNEWIKWRVSTESKCSDCDGDWHASKHTINMFDMAKSHLFSKKKMSQTNENYAMLRSPLIVYSGKYGAWLIINVRCVENRYRICMGMRVCVCVARFGSHRKHRHHQVFIESFFRYWLTYSLVNFAPPPSRSLARTSSPLLTAFFLRLLLLAFGELGEGGSVDATVQKYDW